MAAGRKPTAHLKLVENGRGPGRDSGGRKVAEPPAFDRDIPVKPDDLTEVAAKMWDAIVEQLSKPGVELLKPLDGYALQVGCETFARWHGAKTERVKYGLLSKTSQGMGVSPFVRIEVEASRDFRSWCAEFGLTPAAEARLAAAVEAGGGSGDLF